MDFDDTAEEAAFRAESRAWLSAHAALRSADTPINHSPVEHLRRNQAWQRTMFDEGWAGLTWPVQYGGRGLSATLAAVFNSEQSRYDVTNGVFTVGLAMAGPTIMVHGTDEQKQRYLAPMLRGDELWCQLFSEPGAGSDLASLATRAVLDGDEWVISGQKVWNSMAQDADWGILLARTDPDAPKHKGITYFLVDMRTPGIDVRPLRQITTVAHFNEVYLDDVRIPAANVLGSVNDGWRVTQTTLMNERGAIGGSTMGPTFGDIAALARQYECIADPVIRQELARAYTRFELLRFLRMRVQTATGAGRQPGPEASVMKNIYSRHWTRTGDLVETIMGPSGTLFDYSQPESQRWPFYFLQQWAVRIGGGTEQVQSNILGERVLGLPREPDVSRDLPWKELGKTSSGKAAT